MRRHYLNVFFMLAIGFLFVGCSTPKQPMTFPSHAFDSADQAREADNFQIIMDASLTMADHEGYKFQSAKNLISSMNQTIPEGLGFNGGLRTFGHSPKQSEKQTELVYGMSQYSTSALQQGLDTVNHAGGNSPLPEAIKAAGEDLKGLQGRSALIIVSDGLQMKDAPAAMKQVAEMGNQICAYTVHIGDDPTGRKVLEDVVQAADCGFATTASDLTSQGGMASFVRKALLTGCPDGDNDGVCDSRDQCPGTPQGAPVDSKGCPLDSDNDGVADYLDQCPNTVAGVMVDEKGCVLKYTLHIEFEFDKAEIQPRYQDDLRKAADFIKEYKAPKILIAGHTDNIGEEDYNRDLSQRRAASVRQYLIENFNIKADRLVARGYGESRPVAPNTTPEGRQQNRRVEVICCVIIPD